MSSLILPGQQQSHQLGVHVIDQGATAALIILTEAISVQIPMGGGLEAIEGFAGAIMQSVEKVRAQRAAILSAQANGAMVG
jgi:hypothetical protein